MGLQQIGNLYITYTDKFKSKYYLTSKLHFTKNIDDACLFYLLNSDDTSILNGNTVTINTSNKLLGLSKDGNLQLIDRNISHHYKNDFIITDGENDNKEIGFNIKIYFIIDNNEKLALRFYHSFNLGKDDDIPALAVGSYSDGREIGIELFQFTLIKATENTTNKLKQQDEQISPIKKDPLLENYKGIILIVILLILLMLCLMVVK